MRDIKLRIPKNDFELEEVARYVEQRENLPRYDDLNILASLGKEDMPDTASRSQRRSKTQSMDGYYDQLWSSKH